SALSSSPSAGAAWKRPPPSLQSSSSIFEAKSERSLIRTTFFSERQKMLYVPELQHNSIGMIRHILLLFIVAPACTALSARGAPHAITLTAARTTEKHPLGGTHPITIWCAPDNPPVSRFSRLKTHYF